MPTARTRHAASQPHLRARPRVAALLARVHAAREQLAAGAAAHGRALVTLQVWIQRLAAGAAALALLRAAAAGTGMADLQLTSDKPRVRSKESYMVWCV